MTGFFDKETQKKMESSPILSYLGKFFSVQRLRYDQLVIHTLGEERTIGTIEVTGLDKTLFGIAPATMYSDLGYDNWYELVDYFLEKKVCVINKGSIITNLPPGYFDPPKLTTKSTLLIRRR